jgi:hypothetical protein
MKNNLLYLVPLLLVLASGCANQNIPAPAPALTPQGTFTGQFTLYHLVTKTGKTDSTSANLMLSLETTAGFAVTGDTSTLHAGSHGGYAVDPRTGRIQFQDVTYPATGTPTKVHLSGLYNYVYDGSNLQIAAYGPLDTLTYYYKMKRTGN